MADTKRKRVKSTPRASTTKNLNRVVNNLKGIRTKSAKLSAAQRKFIAKHLQEAHAATIAALENPADAKTADALELPE